jgi:hypothetical protein
MRTHLTLTYRWGRSLALTAATGASLMVSAPAMAELSPALDRASVSAGIFFTDPQVNGALNTQYGNLQSGDIGLGKASVPRIKADFILFDSQGLAFDYYQYSRTYNGTIANNTNLLGTTLTTVGDANLDVKIDFGKIEYKWWFGSADTVVGLGLGAGYYKINMKANVTASVNNVATAASGEYVDDAVAPLLGIGVRHAIDPNFRFFGDFSGMRKVGGQMHGSIYNASVGAEWFVAKNVGVVLDYSMTQIDITRDDTVDVHLQLKFFGPSAFVKVRF